MVRQQCLLWVAQTVTNSLSAVVRDTQEVPTWLSGEVLRTRGGGQLHPCYGFAREETEAPASAREAVGSASEELGL